MICYFNALSMFSVKTGYTRPIRAQQTDSVTKKYSENLIHLHSRRSMRNLVEKETETCTQEIPNFRQALAVPNKSSKSMPHQLNGQKVRAPTGKEEKGPTVSLPERS
jgi:hypothetical protein